MKLESEDKVSSFPLPAPPSLCRHRVTSPAGQRARWELPGENGPQQPSLEQEWGLRGPKYQRETLSSFKGLLGWDAHFWKGEVESGGLGRGRDQAGRGLWKTGHLKEDTHRANYPAGKRPQELPRLASRPPLRVPGLGQLTCNRDLDLALFLRSMPACHLRAKNRVDGLPEILLLDQIRRILSSWGHWWPTPVLLPGNSHGQRAWWAAVHGIPRSRHGWATSLSLLTFMHWRRKRQPTPVFLPGESQGRGNLVGCRLWGCTELDTTDMT